MALSVIPLADMVEQLAEAIAANPMHLITDRAKAMDYFRCVARDRLAVTKDPLARGLLLGFNRHAKRDGGVWQAVSVTYGDCGGSVGRVESAVVGRAEGGFPIGVMSIHFRSAGPNATSLT